ncbi:EamA family transporter [Frigoribacterium faeni]|uniref:Membrane protein n=1 Tax=Frigoribacterium faeni TaxID=145483 RepID=A0ABQ0UTG3_9MICO|nr:EamA family transporter [Frigoribacterium faeni]BFF15905.1 EamA family transporter [Microbacterium flavescens]GEK84770.1 membrane protein [Frigoribacterium faeni]
MSPRDRLLALVVAVCWGVNFPMTALALEHFPPILLVAVRFALLAVPTLLFVPRPAIPWSRLLMVGFALGILQFGFLYLGMKAGMPSGLASLVLQASAPFTVVIAGIWLRERITRRQAIGIGVAVLALAAIAVHRSQVAALLPVVLCLCAALGWGLGNVAVRRAAAPNPLHLTLWMSVVPPIPMLLLSLAVEGPARIGETFATLLTLEAVPSIVGLLYVVLVATVLGYGLWTRLLATYPSSTVAPFSMLVPVVGVLASWWAFGEVPDVVEVVAGVVVVAGVLFASRVPRVRREAGAAAGADAGDAGASAGDSGVDAEAPRVADAVAAGAGAGVGVVPAGGMPAAAEDGRGSAPRSDQRTG